MSDRATQLARCLMEEGIRFPVASDGRIAPGCIRTFLAARFPGISPDEVTRGVLIAIELAKLDRGLGTKRFNGSTQPMPQICNSCWKRPFRWNYSSLTSCIPFIDLSQSDKHLHAGNYASLERLKISGRRLRILSA